MPPRPLLTPDQVGAIPLPDVLRAVERELALRDRVSPHLVRAGRMTPAEAERHDADPGSGPGQAMVGARRLVLDAMPRALPLKERVEGL